MSKNNKPKTIYLFIILLTVIVSITGATYAYWTASANSVNNAVQTSSTIYSISMEITQLYSGFSFIPMNDDDALKALKNECKDKYDRGACAAYKIRVYDYNEDLNFISGFMNINTKNMENISYMMYRISDELDEDNCASINEKNYCIATNPTKAIVDKDLSLGDSYSVAGTTETEFILLIWLTNLNTNQNDTDIGEFNAIVTMQAGNGGEIKGSIASVIKQEDATIPNQDNTEGE